MASATNISKEIERLFKVESGITEEEFGDLLAHIIDNPNKVAEIEEILEYGNDNVRLKFLRKLLLSSGIFESMFDFVTLFANNTEYLLILMLFFSASYHQTRPKNTFTLS